IYHQNRNSHVPYKRLTESPPSQSQNLATGLPNLACTTFDCSKVDHSPAWRMSLCGWKLHFAKMSNPYYAYQTNDHSKSGYPMSKRIASFDLTEPHLLSRVLHLLCSRSWHLRNVRFYCYNNLDQN